MVIRIKERSLLARIAAWWLGVKVVALTWGETIHLHGADTRALLQDKSWLRHELKHVEQFRRYGFLKFLILYVWETLRKGYHQNRFELEARAAEQMTGREEKVPSLAENGRIYRMNCEGVNLHASKI
jgi:Domain of unknown function (DUF4157)